MVKVLAMRNQEMKEARVKAVYRVLRILNDTVIITVPKIGNVREAVEVRVVRFSNKVLLKQVLLEFANFKKEVLSSQKSPVFSESYIGYLLAFVLRLFNHKRIMNQMNLRELRFQVEDRSRTPFLQGKIIICNN